MLAIEKVTRARGSLFRILPLFVTRCAGWFKVEGLEVKLPQFTTRYLQDSDPERGPVRTRRARLGRAADRGMRAHAIGERRRQQSSARHIHGATRNSRRRPAQGTPGKLLTPLKTAAPAKRAMIRAGNMTVIERGGTFDCVARNDPGCVPAVPEVDVRLQSRCIASRNLKQPSYGCWIRLLSSQIIRSDDQLPPAMISFEWPAVELNIVGPEGLKYRPRKFARGGENYVEQRHRIA